MSLTQQLSFIQLHSDVASLIIKLAPAPEIIYWGHQLGHLDDAQLSQMAMVVSRAVPQARLDLDVPVSLCPETGRGSYGSPGLEGHHLGQNSTPIFEYDSHTQTGNQVEIRCVDDIAKLELLISLSMDGKTGVVKKSIQLINNNESAYQLNKLVLSLPLPYHAKELESYTGRWSREFQPQRTQLEHGVFTQENRRGRTSHEYFPGCLIGSHAFSEEQGEVWGFHLAWSGNHSWRAEAKSDGRRFVQAGELLFAGEIELAQGDSYTTPELYASYSQKGINGLRKANHGYVREHLLNFDESKPRPVHLNTWEGIYFDHDPDYICEMATQAAQIGVERFIIDDGWFKGRDHDKAALGDWILDRKKYPNGLTPVIEHVNKLGMEFGIWVEPEMFNPDSDLFRAHPDWLLTAEGYATPTGRYQYVLNLQNQDCFDYLYKCLDELLSENNIGYVKWDMNRELVQATHNSRAAVHWQTKAVYRLLDKLVAAHPDVEIESCSSGGGRIDYEILKRTYRFWTSDCNDALERQTIQKNMGIFFPPEVMGAHIGPHHSHTTRRQHDINLRGITALAGHMGVELDPVKESEVEKQAFAKYIALHKQYRHLLHTGDSFYLDSNDKTRHAYGVHNEREALLTVSQLAMPDYMLPEPVRLSILDSESDYKVKLVEYPQSSAGLMKVMPDWVEQDEVVVNGAILKQVGITLPVLDPEACLLIYIERV
ncbi:alpha-galactosidase [Vibrio maerlii]|uniref:alpha-galactosidase n=1 Tax=Vibrio maerlii TaxID=2231648 RepID=UPI000E3EBB5D|nr:alpha-galactosidase [Vibrio maerlii]